MTPEARSICLFTTARDEGAHQHSGSTYPTFGVEETPCRRRSAAGRRVRAHNLDMAARGLDFPEAFPKNEALDFALD